MSDSWLRIHYSIIVEWRRTTPKMHSQTHGTRVKIALMREDRTQLRKQLSRSLDVQVMASTSDFI